MGLSARSARWARQVAARSFPSGQEIVSRRGALEIAPKAAQPTFPNFMGVPRAIRPVEVLR